MSRSGEVSRRAPFFGRSWPSLEHPRPGPKFFFDPRGLLHGVLAPLLIHGALAALVPVIGRARHRDRGRQDFFAGATSVPSPGQP